MRVGVIDHKRQIPSMCTRYLWVGVYVWVEGVGGWDIEIGQGWGFFNHKRQIPSARDVWCGYGVAYFILQVVGTCDCTRIGQSCEKKKTTMINQHFVQNGIRHTWCTTLYPS